MNFEYLNQMIMYIEEHLTEEINYKKLSKIVGVSEYNLQRIFMFITNVSLSEYIRKRRLSKAFEELKTTKIKIIDLALKYGYESQISFARAFKTMFGVTPSESRINNIEYKLFPIIKFDGLDDKYEELDYKIKELEEITIYCKKIISDTHDDFLYEIRKLYKEIEESGLYNKLNNDGMYGVSFCKDNKFVYLVGSKNKYDGTQKFILPKGKYAIFNVGSRNQKNIVKVEELIYTTWLKSTNYDIEQEFNFELYEKDNCYIYVPIKNKQN